MRAASRAILSDAPRNFSKIDPELANWMLRIESKLDCLMATMGLPQDSALLSGAPVDIELSEDGFTMWDIDGHAAGSWVHVELDLPGPPLHRVSCIARAVEADAAASDSAASFAFEVVREEDREAILAHTLEVQRRELRLRSGVSGAPE